jgi:hypothetical protein
VLSELLAGVMRVTTLWLLIPEMAVYGLAAVLIREVARRSHRGWGSILLHGLAFAVAVECLILQTSLTSQFFPAGASSFGWAAGVQWIYLIALMGYESVYAIVLPIALAELLFPGRRNDPWLSRRGVGIASMVFLVASVGIGWLWSQSGMRQISPTADQVPPINVALALVAVVALVTLGLALPMRAATPARKRAWPPWVLGPIAFIFALFWWILIALPYTPPAALQGASPLVPIAAGLVWATLALLVMSSLSSDRKGWGDRHRFALIFGAIVANMLGGTIVILAADRIDQIGKVVLDLAAFTLLVALAWSRSPPSSSHCAPRRVCAP